MTHGYIDQNKIADIVEKTFNIVYGQPLYDTVFKQAASIMEGIIRLHPFPDGNKRTALLAAHAFLFTNGQYMVVPPDTVRFMVNIAQSTTHTSEEISKLIDNIAAWMEKRTAATYDEYKSLFSKYFKRPILVLRFFSFIRIGRIYARRKIAYWFALDIDPEYGKDVIQTMSFLLKLTQGMKNAIQYVSEHEK